MSKRILAIGIAAVVVVSAGAAAAATATSGSTSSDYNPIASTRLTPAANDTVAAGKTLVIALPATVPASATAVTVNLTVVGGTANGYLLAYADGTTRPSQGSNVNYGKGQTVANQATVPVADGQLDIYNNMVGSGGTVQVIVDLEGWYTPTAAPYTPPASTTWSLPTGSEGTSITTGGSAVSNATPLGTVTLNPGTYLVSFTAKATPTMTSSVAVFPQFFVYDQPLSSSFAGDELNIGSGALESGGNDNIDSYFSGSGSVTITAPDTTLNLYAFGYDSDRGSGTYTLDTATLTAVPLAN